MRRHSLPNAARWRNRAGGATGPRFPGDPGDVASLPVPADPVGLGRCGGADGRAGSGARGRGGGGSAHRGSGPDRAARRASRRGRRGRDGAARAADHRCGPGRGRDRLGRGPPRGRGPGGSGRPALPDPARPLRAGGGPGAQPACGGGTPDAPGAGGRGTRPQRMGGERGRAGPVGPSRSPVGRRRGGRGGGPGGSRERGRGPEEYRGPGAPRRPGRFAQRRGRRVGHPGPRVGGAFLPGRVRGAGLAAGRGALPCGPSLPEARRAGARSAGDGDARAPERGGPLGLGRAAHPHGG